jgi:PKD repeat protein
MLLVLVVMIAGIAIAAAVVAVNAATSAERTRLEHAQEFLQDLTATGKGITLFQGDINGKTPGRLSDLSTPISGTRRDVCGAFYTTTGDPADVDEWSGRYSGRVLPATGTPIGIGVASDTLSYEIVSGITRALVIVREVPEEEAIRLDARVDTLVGTPGSAAGIVQWTTADASGLVTLRWAMPLTTSCPPPNVGPTANFTWVCAQLTCTFTDASTDSDGTVTAWSWSFGDATTSTAQNPVKTYASHATRTVQLTATDDDGAQGSTSQSVTTRNIVLTGVAKRSGGTRWVELTWSGATTTNVDIYRNGVLHVTTLNDGFHSDPTSNATFTYRVCEQGTGTCSNTITVPPA